MGLDILVIPETKKKGKGELQLTDDHILIYSGVPDNKRATDGIGCIINNKLAKHVSNWKGWSERILSVELVLEKEKITIIAVYGPNENEKKEEKEKFWEELSMITENSKGKIFVAGDFNARVGIRKNETERVIGKHGEKERNNNGRKLIEYSMMNNLIITNTFYKHKDIHKFTREVASRNERSIIDYILVEKNNRKCVKDIRVRREAEIYSDHYLLVGKIKIRNKTQEIQTEVKTYTKKQETIKTYKLQDRETSRKYEEIIKNKLQKEKINPDCITIEQLWEEIKNTIINAAREACGVNRGNKQTKRTAWWNNEIKTQIRLKKKAWQEYLSNKTENKYNTYKEQRTKVKILIKEAREKSWEMFGEKLEKKSKENHKLFYRVLKTLRKGKLTRTTTIQNKQGTIITKEEDIMKRWKEYFQELMDVQDVGERGENREKETSLDIEESDKDEINVDITEEELEIALRKMKHGKSPGHDKITTEMIKKMGIEGKNILLTMYNKIFKEEKIPKDWELGQIVPIYKKGNNKQCSNYRGITLLSVPLKIYERILENKLRKVIEPTLAEAQSGFRKGRCTQDHVFTIKQIISKTMTHNKKVFFTFIDLEKAFDRVPRQKVWTSLMKRGVSPKLQRTIKSIYNNTRNYVISNNNISEEFITREGLRQGGVLSPVLFTIFMDDIIRNCERRTKALHVGYRNLQPISISVCAFADDVVLMAGSESELKKNLMTWEEELIKNGMKMNMQKTKVMVVAKEDQEVNITINGTKIEQVHNYTYLGTIIEDTGKQEANINERIDKSNKLYFTINKTFINKKEINQKTKLKIYKTIFRPILTYASESWVLDTRTKSRLEAVEMKYLRRVKGITLRDHIRSQQIREELDIQPLTNFIQKKQLSWWGHLQRLDENRAVKKVWEAKVLNKRKRGRPQTTWDHTIAETLNRKGITWKEAQTKTKDRKQWRNFVKSV